LQWTSQFSSLLHNFALAGQVVGYDTWAGSPYLPLLYHHLTNAFLAAVSVVIPVTAFAALCFRIDGTVLFFSAAALVSLFLSKGTHDPWGPLYQWMVQRLPGFWVFRAPWEKFALVTAVSYAVLIGVTIGHVKQALDARNKAYGAALVVAAFVFAIGYHYPLVLGGMFPAQGERGIMSGFHQRIPSYIQSTAAWLNEMPGDFSVATLPKEASATYTWGYGSPLDIAMRLLRENIISSQYGEGGSASSSRVRARRSTYRRDLLR
jgi:hypothetical protein